MMVTGLTRDIYPRLVECGATVADGGPTFNQPWVNVSCLVGYAPQAGAHVGRRCCWLVLFLLIPAAVAVAASGAG